jgi:hypothetical protein
MTDQDPDHSRTKQPRAPPARQNPAEAERFIRGQLTTPVDQARAWMAAAPHLADPTAALAEAERIVWD